MKCKSRTEYDCFYLDSNNVDEFLIWINEHFVDNYCYMIYDEFIRIQTIQFGYKYYYNRWYVYKDGQLFDYNPEYFLKHYTLILVD